MEQAPMSSFLARRRPERTPVTLAEVQHERAVVGPLAAMLRRAVPDLADYPASPLVDVPANWRAEGAETLIRLPGDLLVTAEVRRTILAAVAAKLGLTDPVVTLHAAGPMQRMVVTPRVLAPASVTWAEALPLVQRAADTAPVLGLAKRRRPVDLDLLDESPNLLISSGTGGGKSVLARSVVCQLLNRGAGVVCLDIKRSSHSWLTRPTMIPGVLYCRDVEEIHNGIIAVAAEADRRNRLADDPSADVGPYICVLAEEMTATMFRLSAWWQEVREKSDPKTSPAVSAFRDLIYMGRAARTVTIGIAQLASARSLGGPEVRENFSVRCLSASRTSTNAWRMLAPEVAPFPRRVKGTGRWQVVKAGEAFETMGIWLTDEEARAHALAGGRPPFDLSVLTARPPVRVDQRPAIVRVLGLTLRQALDQAPDLAPSLDALRKAAQRPGFPEPVGADGPALLYRLDELAAWRRRRDAVRAESIV
jgi:hypothetical protein